MLPAGWRAVHRINSGTTSQYELSFRPDAAGVYNVVVQAYDATTGNTGVDRTSFTVAAR
jgi:hypothetical protein